jgi:hypothetical protein
MARSRSSKDSAAGFGGYLSKRHILHLKVLDAGVGSAILNRQRQALIYYGAEHSVVQHSWASATVTTVDRQTT